MNMLTATACLIFRGLRPVERRPPDKKKEEQPEEEHEERESASGRKRRAARGPEGSNVRTSERIGAKWPESDALENTGG